MAVNRKTVTLRKGDVIDVLECPKGNYGLPGMPRVKKKKPTKEQMVQVNLLNKARRARLKMLAYFNYGDYFVTWTYRVDARPPDMKGALKDFQRAMRKVRVYYKKQGYECFWLRNIERGTKGGWHIHMVINNIPGAREVLEEVWTLGDDPHIVRIKKSKYYDEDFTRLSNYITKDENTIVYNKDGTRAKSKIKEANYNSSRNMQLPKPENEELKRWKKEVKPKKGYYIINMHEGENPATKLPYRRYTMIRIRGDDEDVRSEYIFGDFA